MKRKKERKQWFSWWNTITWMEQVEMCMCLVRRFLLTNYFEEEVMLYNAWEGESEQQQQEEKREGICFDVRKNFHASLHSTFPSSPHRKLTKAVDGMKLLVSSGLLNIHYNKNFIHSHLNLTVCLFLPSLISLLFIMFLFIHILVWIGWPTIQLAENGERDGDQVMNVVEWIIKRNDCLLLTLFE